VRTLSGGQRQAVAIARTRIAAAKLVLLDEPTASISVRQVAEVLDLMRRMRDHGQSVIFISHAMPHIFAVADRITVLRRGQKVADKQMAATSPEKVTALITGAVERVDGARRGTCGAVRAPAARMAALRHAAEPAG
jgi:simple sugar transport system ATP-binding protein